MKFVHIYKVKDNTARISLALRLIYMELSNHHGSDNQGNRMKILLNYVEITQIKYGYILQERNNKACLLQNIILES